MHLPIANNLASRDGTTAKDEGGRNVVIETDGEASVCLKRPGALSLGAVGTGVGQLLACYNNQLKSIVGNTLADLAVTVILPSPGTPGAGTYKTLPSAGASSYTCISSDGTNFVGVIQSGTATIKSSDGETWTSGGAMPFAPALWWTKAVYGAGRHVCVPAGDTGNRYAYTTNGGTTWLTGWFPVSVTAYNIKFVNGLFVVVGDFRILTSSDGASWTSISLSGMGYPSGTPKFHDVAFGNGVYVLFSKSTVGNAPYTSKTANFSSWTNAAQPANPYIDFNGATADYVIFDGSKFVLPCNATSTDGQSWTTQSPDIAIGHIIQSFAFDSGLYVAGVTDANDEAFTATSTDGFTWTDIMYFADAAWPYSIAYGSGKYIIMDTLGDRAVEAYPFNGNPASPGGLGASVSSSQAITSIDPDLPFFAQVAGQAQSQNVIVFKNAKEAWVYKP